MKKPFGSTVCPPGTILDAAGTCIGIASCPEGTTLNPVTMTCEAKKKYTLYIVLGIAALFLLSGD